MKGWPLHYKNYTSLAVSRERLGVSSSVAPFLSWFNLSSTQAGRSNAVLGEDVSRISAQQTFEELGVLHSGYKGKDGRSRVKFGHQRAFRCGTASPSGRSPAG